MVDKWSHLRWYNFSCNLSGSNYSLCCRIYWRDLCFTLVWVFQHLFAILLKKANKQRKDATSHFYKFNLCNVHIWRLCFYNHFLQRAVACSMVWSMSCAPPLWDSLTFGSSSLNMSKHENKQKQKLTSSSCIWCSYLTAFLKYLSFYFLTSQGYIDTKHWYIYLKDN